MEKVCTNWTQATNNPTEIMMGLVSCLEAGYNAWIEIRKNGDQTHPVMKKNPALDNPFNWKQNYSTMKHQKQMKEHKFFNETERDIVYNWTSVYGTPEAIKAYQEEGRIKEGLLFADVGESHLVRINDANWYREHITKDGYKYGAFVVWPQPKQGIPYWVVDDSIDEVFVVCYDDNPLDMSKALKKASEYLAAYAKERENK